MTDLAKYVVKLEAEVAGFRRDLRRAQGDTRRFHRRMTGFADGLTSSFRRLAGGAAMGAVVVQAGRMADRFNRLNARIRTATRATGDYEQVQRRLVATSIQTGASLEATVDTFQAFSRIREDIGATNDQVITLSRTISQLGVIGGTSQGALNNGIRQFNQAIAAGVFRAEEFNSIVENMPELAARIAKGFNVTQGELRGMVLSGKLFANDVVNKLLEQSGEIAQQFEAIPNNLDRAFSSLTTAIGSALSKLDEAVGATRGLADFIDELATRISVATGTATPVELLELRLTDLLREQQSILNQMQTTSRGNSAFTVMSDNVQALGEQIAAVTAGLIELQRLESQTAGAVGGGRVALDKAIEEAFRENFEIFNPAQAKPDDFAGIVGEGVDTEAPFFGFDLGRMSENFKKIEDETTAFGERMKAISNRAASNIQDAFADFLFDPFEDGLRGMLKGFIDIIRRMAANQAAAGIFNFLGQQGGFLGSFFGGAKADGGPVSPNRAFLVGERGPELFVPRSGGTIVPNGGAGGVTVVNNNNFGAGVNAAELAGAMEATRQQTRADVLEALRRGRF